MSEQITREVFDHLVSLAALQLEDDQADYLRAQLNNQLKAISELAAIPLDGDIPANLHGVPYDESFSAAPREDIWLPYPDPDAILAQAPQVEERVIVVPDIPHTELK